MGDWQQVVEGLEISFDVRDPPLAKVDRFLDVYAWKAREAEVRRPSRKDYPHQRIGLEAVQVLD